MHSKKREDNGTCCQQHEQQEKNEQDTYEYKINTKVKNEVPDWKVQTSEWNVEDTRKWKTEDTDRFFYNIEENKND